MGVLLALWLLGVGEANVLPLACVKEFFTRLCLRQKPCFYFIVWVDANPWAKRKRALLKSINLCIKCFLERTSSTGFAENHLNVREPVEKSAHIWSISALEPMDMMWMRPSSASLDPAWEEAWWGWAAGGLPSSGRQWPNLLKHALVFITVRVEGLTFVFILLWHPQPHRRAEAAGHVRPAVLPN